LDCHSNDEVGGCVVNSPTYRQYKSIKRQYPEWLLLFPLGEFYEVYGEDAGVVADVLGLEVGSRKLDNSVRTPPGGRRYNHVDMAHFSIACADGYIAKLL